MKQNAKAKKPVTYPVQSSVVYPRPQKPKYREQYGVIVICHDERDQAKVYRQLLRSMAPREVKVVCT